MRGWKGGDPSGEGKVHGWRRDVGRGACWTGGQGMRGVRRWGHPRTPGANPRGLPRRGAEKAQSVMGGQQREAEPPSPEAQADGGQAGQQRGTVATWRETPGLPGTLLGRQPSSLLVAQGPPAGLPARAHPPISWKVANEVGTLSPVKSSIPNMAKTHRWSVSSSTTLGGHSAQGPAARGLAPPPHRLPRAPEWVAALPEPLSLAER